MGHRSHVSWRDYLFLGVYALAAVFLFNRARLLYDIISVHGKVHGLGLVPWWGYGGVAVICAVAFLAKLNKIRRAVAGQDAV
jgi:hypothetical protein